jgi:hypothetical protein
MAVAKERGVMPRTIAGSSERDRSAEKGNTDGVEARTLKNHMAIPQ